MRPQCKDCYFAFQRKDELWECRYHPPMPNVPDNDWNRDSWRLVSSDFWCGKHTSEAFYKNMIKDYTW